MHVNGLYNRILCTDKIRIFCPIQNLKTDSESAENSASNCVFEIFKSKIFITHAGGVKMTPFGPSRSILKDWRQNDKLNIHKIYQIYP